MKSLNTLIAKLRAIDLNGPDAVTVFETQLCAVLELGTPDIILPLLCLLDDQSPYDELMFSIIHGVERFEDRPYVEHVLQGSMELCDRAPGWTIVLFIRMLNSESTRLELIKQLRSAPTATKAAVKDLMERINVSGPAFLSKTAAVIAAASPQS